MNRQSIIARVHDPWTVLRRFVGQMRPSRLRHRVAQQLAQRVRVNDGSHDYVFICRSVEEVSRARSLLTKEAGTIDWIASQVRDGDIFYDIGANIGLYSVFAARRLQGNGHVYAFEPHLENATSLIRNVQANELDDLVTVSCSALHDHSAHLIFNYHSLEPGSSRSQLAHDVLPFGERFTPVARELKAAISIDDLVSAGAIEAPNLVKIDVDGNEMLVLQGMHSTLSRDTGPRSLQVEVSGAREKDIAPFLAELGYKEMSRHYTASGQRRIGRGEDVQHIAHNAIFERAAP